MDKNFKRIASFLRDEGIPKTPQEISSWTGIELHDVYDTLRTNTTFFREVFDKDDLRGWVIDNPYF